MTDDYRIHKEVSLTKKHHITGQTRHFRDGDRVINIANLKIVSYPKDAGFYLLYFDKEGNELTDTYHDTINDAIDQAKFEFEVEPADWKAIG